MHEFRMDSTGSPVPFDSLASSHHARHGLSRRAFIGGAAAATGATLGSGILSPAVGLAGSHSHPAPRPTTGITTLEGIDFHFTIFGPGVNLDLSSITDFKGSVGVAQVQGTGTGRKPNGKVETLLFDTDMRFMKGVYIGQDGSVHRGRSGSFDSTSTEVSLTSQTSPPRFTTSTRGSIPTRTACSGRSRSGMTA
jgi:hypothetical protein